MPPEPVPQQPGRDEDPRLAVGWPDWMDDPAYLALRAADEDLDHADVSEDLEDAPPPEVDPDELAAEADRITGELAREAVLLARLGLTGAMAADAAAAAGRRGPGMPGSAHRVPGISASRAAGFASGMPLDTAPGSVELARFAEEAAGEDDRYPGANDDELSGAIAAWARIKAYASSREHAAVAELIRRRPAPGCVPAGPAQMPEAPDEFAAKELASVLGETRPAAGDMVSLAQELEVNLPSTKAAFRAGILSERKTAITAWAKELKRAGVEGGMDALRARAYLDILLGMDSRPPGRTRAAPSRARIRLSRGPRIWLSSSARARRRAGHWPG